MSDFDALCKQLEKMDPETFAQIFNDKSVDVISALVALTADGKDGITAYMQFVLASVAADGVLSKPEFTLLKPWFDRMTDKDTTYEEAVEIFNGIGLDDPDAYKDMAAVQIDLVGRISTLVSDIRAKVDAMVAARKKANVIADEYEKAVAYHEIAESLFAIRKSIDRLEEISDNDTWPLPKYREILFIN